MSDYGTLLNETTIRFERTLPGPVERVWAYLVEAEKRALWFAGGHWDLVPGGRAEFAFHNAALTAADDLPPQRYASEPETHEGRVLEIDPPRLVVFEWSEASGGVSQVRFELRPTGDQVTLTLIESGLGNREAVVGNAGGWHAHLDVLKARLEGTELPRFWATIEKVEAEYADRIVARHASVTNPRS